MGCAVVVSVSETIPQLVCPSCGVVATGVVKRRDAYRPIKIEHGKIVTGEIPPCPISNLKMQTEVFNADPCGCKVSVEFASMLICEQTRREMGYSPSDIKEKVKLAQDMKLEYYQSALSRLYSEEAKAKTKEAKDAIRLWSIYCADQIQRLAPGPHNKENTDVVLNQLPLYEQLDGTLGFNPSKPKQKPSAYVSKDENKETPTKSNTVIEPTKNLPEVGRTICNQWFVRFGPHYEVFVTALEADERAKELLEESKKKNKETEVYKNGLAKELLKANITKPASVTILPPKNSDEDKFYSKYPANVISAILKELPTDVSDMCVLVEECLTFAYHGQEPTVATKTAQLQRMRTCLKYHVEHGDILTHTAKRFIEAYAAMVNWSEDKQTFEYGAVSLTFVYDYMDTHPDECLKILRNVTLKTLKAIPTAYELAAMFDDISTQIFDSIQQKKLIINSLTRSFIDECLTLKSVGLKQITVDSPVPIPPLTKEEPIDKAAKRKRKIRKLQD